MGYVPVDRSGNVIPLTSGGSGGAFTSGGVFPPGPEVLSEEELDYGIPPDSTSTPLKPPEDEFLQVGNSIG